jgi:hypothetical protein
MALRSKYDCVWYAASASVAFAFVLSACGPPSSIEREAWLGAASATAAPADEPPMSRAIGDVDSVGLGAQPGEQPGETIENPGEFSAAVFLPVEFLDLDAIAAELWPAAPAPAHGGVTFVAVDGGFADPASLERSSGESAATDFDAWDRVEAPDRPEFDGLDLAPVAGPDA